MFFHVVENHTSWESCVFWFLSFPKKAKKKMSFCMLAERVGFIPANRKWRRIPLILQEKQSKRLPVFQEPTPPSFTITICSSLLFWSLKGKTKKVQALSATKQEVHSFLRHSAFTHFLYSVLLLHKTVIPPTPHLRNCRLKQNSRWEITLKSIGNSTLAQVWSAISTILRPR